MRDISVLGLDIAKLNFHVVGMNKQGKVLLRKRLNRSEVLDFFANHKSILVGMESCGSSSYWSRAISNLGHEVRLMSPQFVKPYVKSNKNDLNDAEAIAEAVSRKNMRFVTAKSIEQQDIQLLHKARERLVKSRTSIINEIRGFLGEYGIILPQGKAQFKSRFIEEMSKDSSKLSSLGKESFYELYKEYLAIEERCSYFEDKLKSIGKLHPECRRLEQIPGVGYLTATAIVGMIGNISNFKSSREFAAYLGIVPRQHSTGGKNKLLGISKRGNVYLRKLLVHGARASLRWVDKQGGRRGVWLKQLKQRRGHNIATVALANKNARVIWVLLTRQEDYRNFDAVEAVAPQAKACFSKLDEKMAA